MTDQTVERAAELALEQPPTLIQTAPSRARFALIADALRLWRTRVGLAIVALLVLIALVGPLVAPHSPTEFVGIPNSPPSGDAIFGTDALGRDVLSRFLHGGATVLWLSAAATLLGVVLGVVVGLIAAYARNWLDDVLMRGNDVLLAFPQIIFVLLAVSAIGPKLWLIVLTVGLTHAPRVARVIRGAALEIVERDFVKSAEVVGEKRWRIVFAEVLPNVTSPLLVELGLRMTYSIGLVAGISFLGFGLQPPAADWGLMINENRLSITVQAWAVVLPVIAIGLLTVGTNLITDGVSRALAGIDRKADS
jgi:peptide/nickel transport system permease protein